VTAIATFIEERNRALATGDLDTVIAFLRTYSAKEFSSRDVAEIAMHKAITGCADLDLAHRKKSKAWLLDRGYKSFDDGDL
jgi:hypothetical protein